MMYRAGLRPGRGTFHGVLRGSIDRDLNCTACDIVVERPMRPKSLRELAGNGDSGRSVSSDTHQIRRGPRYE